MKHFLSFLSIAVLLTSCAGTAGLHCADGEDLAVSESLYFGRAKPAGEEVSDSEWAEFLRSEVTPRFPAGLSVWEAAGQWRSDDGSIVRENSFVLNLIHSGSAASSADVRAIATEYKNRFQQEAVLRVRSRICASL